jgi:hypothetical protein
MSSSMHMIQQFPTLNTLNASAASARLCVHKELGPSHTRTVATYTTSGACASCRDALRLTWIYGPTGHAIGGTAQQALRSFYNR